MNNFEYFEQERNAEEQKAFEQELAQNDELRKEYRAYQALTIAIKRIGWKQDIQSAQKQHKVYRTIIKAVIAIVALTLIAGVTYVLTNQSVENYEDLEIIQGEKTADITEPETLEKMNTGFVQIINILEDDKLLLKDRLLQLVDSPFIYSILEHKNFAREREMRRLTLEISNFIEAASQGVTSNEQFLKNLLAQSLREAANSIQSDTLRSSDLSTNAAWVDALKVGLEIMASQQKI